MLTTVHPATSPQDALEMLEEIHIPLTHSEKKLIVESLWDAAFREGARQGRQAGIEHAESTLRNFGLDWPADVLRAEPRTPREEYEDPTIAIRRRLEARTKIDGRYTN